MTGWAYWFHLAALAATAAAYWPMRKANAGAMGEFHRQGSAELVTAWMKAHEEALPALRELLRADMRFLFCYPWLFVSMASMAGDAPSTLLAAVAAAATGIADYLETSKGLSILGGGEAGQAEAMARASVWKWRLFGIAALLAARTLYSSAGFSGRQPIAHAMADCFLLVCFLSSGSKPAIAGLSFFAAALAMAVAW